LGGYGLALVVVGAYDSYPDFQGTYEVQGIHFLRETSTRAHFLRTAEMIILIWGSQRLYDGTVH